MSVREKRGIIVAHEEGLRKDLKDPKFAAEYLRACVEQSASDMPEVVLEAIREVADVHGMAWVAKEIGVDRTALYRMLSPEGNPTIRNFMAILHRMGLRMTFEPSASRRSSPKKRMAAHR
jgi:probable addiction module antidote protein